MKCQKTNAKRQEILKSHLQKKKKKKYLGINLTKETKDLPAENYQTLIRKLKLVQGNGCYALGLEELILLR